MKMMRFTATKLADYHRCGFLFRALHVHRIPTGFVAARRRGITVHAISHVADSYATRAGKQAASESLLRLMSSVKERERARELLLAYEELRSAEPQLLIEKTIDARVAGQIVRVRPDRVERFDVDGLAVIDIKTGIWIDEDHERTKMRAASVALDQRFDRRVEAWFILDLANRRRVDIGPAEPPRECGLMLARLVRGIEAQRLAPRPGTYCRRCPARAYCPEATPRPRSLPPASSGGARPAVVQATLFPASAQEVDQG